MYSTIVQEIVDTLEEHVLSDWQLEHYANRVGYSKFYLTRQFKKETGMTIGVYVRKRRLAVAAYLLLHTHYSILDISYECQFQSQEAFTRAFKDVYKMPPGKYRTMMRSLTQREEEMMTINVLKGWALTGSNPVNYVMEADDQIFHTGSKSGHLRAIGAVEEGQFGTMMQAFAATNWLGKRMKLSCFIKTKDAVKCGAWCRIDANDGDLLQFDNMDNRTITGTTDWNYYAIVLDVPQNSASIHFGLLLSGTGDAWIDGISFEEVNHTVASTNMLEATAQLPSSPINLAFDDL